MRSIGLSIGGWILFALVGGQTLGHEPQKSDPSDSVPLPTVEELENQGFVHLFDGKTLSGWKTANNPKAWVALEDGSIRGAGLPSHLFSPKEYTDFHWRAEVKLTRRGNSGMYFRTEFGPGFPNGYEAQVNNSSSDPRKTGSLYKFSDVHEQLVADDTWWVQEVICRGNHIVIKVDGKTVVDFVDEKNTYTKGHLAFQQHDPWTVVHYRNVMIKEFTQDD